MFDFEQIEREILESRQRTMADSRRSLLDHRWVGMALLLFIIGGLTGNLTLMGLTGFMLVIVTAAWLWSRNALHNVHYGRQFEHKRVFPGEEIEAQIVVENRKFLPLGWLQVEDEWPPRFGPVDEGRLSESPIPDLGYLTNTYTLRWFQRVRRRIRLLARERGIFQVGPAFGMSGDPFNLFERGAVLGRAEFLVVYPTIKPLEELGLLMKDPLGSASTRQQLFEDPNRMMGVRDYRPEDGMRRVHWKATARTGSLQTRVYEPTRSVNMALCLNVATFEQYWHGFWPEMLETLVSTTASLAAWSVEQQYAVGVVANGTLAHADQPFRVAPGRSRDQLLHILETLAGVSSIVTQEFGQFLLEESPHLPWGTTLVIVTAFMTPAIEDAIIRLRDSGRRIVLLVLGKARPADIPGVLIHHLPIASEPPPPIPEEADDTALTPRDRFLRERARQEARP